MHTRPTRPTPRMNSTPCDSVDLPEALSPARASRTGRGPAALADTRGAIDGTWSDMVREPIAVGSRAGMRRHDRGFAAGGTLGAVSSGKERQVGNDTQRWNELAAQIAVDSIRATTAAGSGHPTSSMSCAHLLAVLFADHLRFDVKDPAYRANDRFILSKGHAVAGALRRR